MQSEITIRRWRDSDSIAELTQLLHRGYEVWLQQNIMFTATNQSEETTRDRLEGTETFVAELDGKMVGCISLHEPQADHEIAYYNRPCVLYFGQMTAVPELRGQGLGRKLIATVEDRARELGATEIACDTAEPAIWLNDYYQSLGFKRVEHYDWQFTNYRSIVYAKPLT